jgi:hypothetical protein
MEFVQVHGKLSCVRGCNVTFGVYREVWVITFVSKEGGDASRGICSIVVGKLGDRQEFSPIVLLVVAIDSEVLLEGLIRLFALSIAFRVLSGGEVESHVKCSS